MTFQNGFCWADGDALAAATLSDNERYGRIVRWAVEARRRNPGVFDALTEWILDDSQWGEEKLAENQEILLQGVLARFREQNARLRALLKAMAPSGAVNEAVFAALDGFDEELSGRSRNPALRETIARVFADFSLMRDRGVREQIAGGKTGPDGTDAVPLFGYVNCLKDCDAQVQWTLFMPEVAQRQQKGFKVERFEYKKLPAMRFVGQEGEALADVEKRKALFAALDALKEYRTEFDCDVLFMHHYGLGVDVGPWHGVWGRFLKADAPVPAGFLHFDFVPQRDDTVGPPYCSQLAYAAFSGAPQAMHRREGYDSDAMYDVTRNIILGQGVSIPYPDKYWTAEVFPDGCDKDSTAYLFSVEL